MTFKSLHSAASLLALLLAPGLALGQSAEAVQGQVPVNSVFESTFMAPEQKIPSMANPTRVRDTDFELIYETLELKDGDRLLDIGAGIGFLTLPIARKLNNTGLITATDVDSKMLAVLEQGKKKLGLTNIETVVVGIEGVDPKYLERRYDKALICHVVQDMGDPVSFFGTLFPQFEPGAIVVIVHPTAGVFTVRPENVNWTYVHGLVTEFDDRHPLLRRISPEVREGIVRQTRAGLPPELLKRLQADLAVAVEDRFLVRDLMAFIEDTYFSWTRESRPMFSVDKQRLFGYLMRRYMDTLFKAELSDEEREMVVTLNSMVLGAMLLNKSGSESFFYERSIVQSGEALQAQMKRAGYVFVKDYYPNPSFVVLKFRKP